MQDTGVATQEANGPELEQLMQKGFESIDRVTYDQARNEAAETLFQEALVKNPGNRRALCGLACAESLLKKWDSALAHYEQILNDSAYRHATPETLRKDKVYVLALRGKGYCLINDKKFPEAVEIFTILTDDLAPGDWRNWYNKGYALIKLNRWAEAEACLIQFLEFDDKKLHISDVRLEVLNYLGFAAFNLDNLDRADKYFDQAMAEDPLSFGEFVATVGKTLVQQKRYYFDEQRKLINTAREYLICLLKDFRSGLNIVEYMFIIQFSVGIFLILSALVLVLMGNTTLIPYITGVSGGLIAVLSLVFSAPADLQKNRVDFSQWMIAYFHWINTLYAVSGAIDQETRDWKEIDWEKIRPIQDYFTKVTKETIVTVEQYCEFPKKTHIPGLAAAEPAGGTTQPAPGDQTPPETGAPKPEGTAPE